MLPPPPKAARHLALLAPPSFTFPFKLFYIRVGGSFLLRRCPGNLIQTEYKGTWKGWIGQRAGENNEVCPYSGESWKVFSLPSLPVHQKSWGYYAMWSSCDERLSGFGLQQESWAILTPWSQSKSCLALKRLHRRGLNVGFGSPWWCRIDPLSARAINHCALDAVPEVYMWKAAFKWGFGIVGIVTGVLCVWMKFKWPVNPLPWHCLVSGGIWGGAW